MTGKLPASASSNGVAVTFNKLTYSVPVKKSKERYAILKDLSGAFQPGRLTALMGPSGSGKTTLMDILAGRKSGAGQIDGEVLYGGSAAAAGVLKHLCGYVEQFDTLLGELTVDQMLMYTAEMKLPRSLQKADKRKRVDSVISQLRLEKCRNTVIGNVLRRGISGGQAKRVNVALSLISQPLVVFLDEPTSGLDSKMANEVCSILKELGKEGYTIVATIHSPTSYAFSLFDDLMMLQAGGAMVYAGQVADVKSHFVHCGYPFPEEQGYSLPDWLVDTTSGATGSLTDADGAEDGAAATADFSQLWLKSPASEAYSKDLNETFAKLKAEPLSLKTLPTSGPGQLHALKTLLSYRMSTHYRDGEFLGPRFGDKIFMALLTLSLYWGIGTDLCVPCLACIKPEIAEAMSRVRQFLVGSALSGITGAFMLKMHEMSTNQIAFYLRAVSSGSQTFEQFSHQGSLLAAFVDARAWNRLVLDVHGKLLEFWPQE